MVGDDLVDLARSALDRTGAPDVVFQGAGVPTVGAASADPAASFDVTVRMTKDLLDLMVRRMPDATFVYPSSGSVYGDCATQPLSETISVDPVSLYAEHKVLAEEACTRAAASGLATAIIRYFSIYGPGLRKQLLWELSRKLLIDGDAVMLSGTGQETRDFLHVEDAAELAFLVMEAAGQRAGSTPLVINGGTGDPVSVKTVADIAVERLRPNASVSFTHRRRRGDPLHLQADTQVARSLGFMPKWSPREGLRQYFDWAKPDLSPVLRSHPREEP